MSIYYPEYNFMEDIMDKSELLHHFRDYLGGGNFGPGDKLPGEIELAASFGVSRGDIREMLMHFAHLGVLHRVKKRGTFIREIPYEDLHDDISLCFKLAKMKYEDLSEARLALELAVVPLIVKRISRESAERMEEKIDAMENAATPEEADACDRDFHLIFFEIAGNSALRLFSNVLYTLFRSEYRKKVHTPEWIARSVATHREILAAAKMGDASGLTRLITEHLGAR